jgi:signal peptidase II
VSEDSPQRGRWLTFAAVAAVVVVADQLSKAWIAASFSAGTATEIIGDLVRIVISHNSGGIFGLFGGSAPLLALASTVVIAVIVLYQRRVAVEGPWLLNLALGLLLGGAVGNLVDRLRWGYVLDFVDMGIGNARWYTFNVADAAISTAIVLLIAVGLLGARLPARLR